MAVYGSFEKVKLSQVYISQYILYKDINATYILHNVLLTSISYANNKNKNLYILVV